MTIPTPEDNLVRVSIASPYWNVPCRSLYPGVCTGQAHLLITIQGRDEAY